MASPDDAGHRPPPALQHNPHSSASLLRHQESSAFHRHAGLEPGLEHAEACDAIPAGSTDPLASFLNASRVEADGDGATASQQPITMAAVHGAPSEHQGQGQGRASAAIPDGKDIICGPLLNYRRMDESQWYGSVLIVVEGGGEQPLHQPSLSLHRLGPAGQPASDGADAANGAHVGPRRLYSDPRATFWAFDLAVPLEPDEIKYDYHLPGMHFTSPSKPRVNGFFVPAADESMRIMFHSCNGFSVGTDEAAFSGAPLWNDVLRRHEHAPLHVMVGGGDQIYNDGIRVNGPLRAWTDIGNPKKRRDYPFPESLRAQCDDCYLQNYIRWYGSEPFAIANGQIPQINIWDDHDIIDGFGSYVDHFMRCDVFRGIGGIAHKYYMLFQQHMAPPKSTYTSDHLDDKGEAPGPDPNQLVKTFVADPELDRQYVVGQEPGPYVAEHSYNIYSRLGARIALVGIDARTERTRHQINYPETYRLIFTRLRHELRAAARSSRPIKHLILLLGIPIAYPRLTWLENVLRSPFMGPVKFLNRRFGLGGGLFNHFDGSIDILDDLDDHYTARIHKTERAGLIARLQEVAAEFSVRVTILGGDVHLAAVGRFYSNPKLQVAVEQDQRYMVNIISSAIVNKPPPPAIANLLARRNKIHHLDPDTDETLLDLFDKDPGTSEKTASHNKCTMPSRNYAILTENSPNNVAVGRANGEARMEHGNETGSFFGRSGHAELHNGEVGSGTKHKAASPETHGRGSDESLDICINVEIDQHDAEGKTQGYGMTVPALRCETRPADA